MAKVGKEPLFNESEEKRFCRSCNLYDRCRIWLHKKQHSNDCKILCLVLEKDTDNKIGVISAKTGFVILRAGGHNELKIVKSQKPYKKKRAYFKELTTIMVAKNLVDKPNRIINIDETEITPYHAPQCAIVNVFNKSNNHSGKCNWYSHQSQMPAFLEEVHF